MSEIHRDALAHLLYGIQNDGCLVLLTGEVGTGKTTVCRCLLEQLPAKTDTAVILNPSLTVRDLLKSICEDLEILPKKQYTVSVKAYIDHLNEYLLDAHAKGRTTVIIIDEAQNLRVNVLEQLRLLTNLETNTQKLLRIVLIGQPELREMLTLPELSQINQRITSRYHLKPLQPEDVYAYLQHRLNIAGRNSVRLFSDKAIGYAIKRTGGVPRLLNVICDRALLGAYATNADHVDLAIMKRAVKEVFPGRYRRFTKKFLRAFMMILIFGSFVTIPTFCVTPTAAQVNQATPLPPVELSTGS